MKAFLYARVSTEGKVGSREEQDPENQLFHCRKYCDLYHYEIAGEYVDRESGKSVNRPKLLKMLEDLGDRKAECIIVWKLDRLTRMKPVDALTLISSLKKNKIDVISVSEQWLNTTGPMAEPMLYMISWLAEQERESISKRIKAGIEAKRSRGLWGGGRPPGSKDTKKRERRWLKRPAIEMSELVSSLNKRLLESSKP